MTSSFFRPRVRRGLVALALAAALLATPAAAPAADFHVDGSSGDDASAGTSWALAVRTIGRGIALAGAAAGPDRVLVAAGTYVENLTLDQVDVDLLGGHPPGGAGARDPAIHETIVDGGGLGPGLLVSADGGLTVLDGITVDGFTFRNGRQLGRADILGAGGGVFIEEAEVVLTNNVFTSNVSDGAGLLGAALYVYRATARASTITGNRFEDNEARNGGGGAVAIADFMDAATSPPVDFSGNVVRNNRATSLAGADPSDFSGVGGGVLAWRGKPRITNNVIESNLAESQNGVAYTGQGGGVFLIDAAPILTGNIIRSNVARGLSGNFGGSGGGMYAWWNTSTQPGGVPMAMNGNVIENNLAQGGTGQNQAAGGGVAIGIVGDTAPTLRDNTFTGNVAVGGSGLGSALGGGLFVYMLETGPAYLTVTGGSFESNSAEAGGGGMWLQGGRAGRLAATDVLVRDNRADYGSGVMLFGDGSLRNMRIRENRLYDPDGDQVSEIVDNCPGVYNPVQSDADGDGIGDACDDDSDGDGIPDVDDPCPLVPGTSCAGDQDGDGILDDVDNCPLVANPGQEDASGDGVGDACEPAVFDGLETNAGGVWVYGDGTLTNLEIVGNAGQGLLIVGDPGDGGSIPENPSSPRITNVTIADNQAAGFITYLASGTVFQDSVIARNLLSDGFDTERAGGVPSSPGMTCNSVYFWDGLASLPCTGSGNLDFTDGDAWFAPGALGDHYLQQVAAGDPRTFVGVDAGTIAASSSQVNGMTTRVDAVADSGQVDLGYHYPLSAVVTPQDPFSSAVRVARTDDDVVLWLTGFTPGVAAARWYRGSIDLLRAEYSHQTPFTGSPSMPECSGPPEAPIGDPAARMDGNDWYYLAVSLDGGTEGTFGASSLLVERPRPDDDAGDLVINGCP